MANRMDIEDILLEADPSLRNVQSGNRDLQLLTRAWVAERSAPEVLPWPQDNFIERVNERIKTQIEKIEEMTGSMDPKTNFSLIVIQTELERWKYLVRSILRARIAKIDKHALHYLTPPNSSVLSDSEIAYASRHSALLNGHYKASFLGSFPAALQRMDDTAGGTSMIDGPDLETAAFVRVLKEGVVVEGRGRDEDDRMVAGAGEIIVARWNDVKELVERGNGELV